jgi:hypothetical protein
VLAHQPVEPVEALAHVRRLAVQKVPLTARQAKHGPACPVPAAVSKRPTKYTLRVKTGGLTFAEKVVYEEATESGRDGFDYICV